MQMPRRGDWLKMWLIDPSNTLQSLQNLGVHEHLRHRFTEPCFSEGGGNFGPSRLTTEYCSHAHARAWERDPGIVEQTAAPTP